MGAHRKNVAVWERVIRIVAGGLVVGAAAALLAAGASVWAAAAYVALAALGADFVYTGITGYCPLYRMLGWSSITGRAGDRR